MNEEIDASAFYSSFLILHSSFAASYNPLVKANVYVSLKKSVLDPQGKTIHGALRKMGYQGISDIRQGKYFEITLDGMDESAAKQEIERMAREVLTNPVIEDFHYSIESK